MFEFDIFEKKSHDESMNEADFTAVLESVSESFEGGGSLLLEGGHVQNYDDDYDVITINSI